MLSKYDIVTLHCSIMILLYDFVISNFAITLWYCNMIYDAKNIAFINILVQVSVQQNQGANGDHID